MPSMLDNTMKTVMGFSFSIRDCNITKEEKLMLLFSLTSILQAAFLRKDTSKESLGFGFNEKEEREAFIDFIIDKLFGGKCLDENTYN